MYPTRPKSSRGRSRPATKSSLSDSDNNLKSDVSSKLDRSFVSRSQPDLRPARRCWNKDEVLQIVRHGPAAPPPSLSRYKVLPSIERRQSAESPGKQLNGDMSKLGLCDEEDRRPDEPPGVSEAAAACGSLLLAVRAPCGRRFEQHFDPADTLLAVSSRAETRFGATYGRVFLQTAEVPRRTFTDLNMTLEQCGIPNRSLLCISQNRSA
ncbi:UBX domain-containing protein 10 [Kryptolebias marmoratus]|uniref:UBX domain-containing protein 10 n=1 Tax=Kryptolebias marmoratus TaxID=37003 RepID=UPI0007F8B10B|nr:UBX domain-containing protein 10 [Kryptolebias marmoratus]